MTTWADSHPEALAIFGQPFTADGRKHREKTFIPWPHEVYSPALPAIQPTVVKGANDELFAKTFSLRSWELGMVARSTDGGKTWSHIGSNIDPRFTGPPPGYKALKRSIDALGITASGTLVAQFCVQYNDGRKYGGLSDPTYHRDAYAVRSTDNGKTWSKPVLLNDSPLENAGANVTRFARLPNGVMALATPISHQLASGKQVPLSMMYEQTMLWRSSDDGKTWKKRAKPICLHGSEPDLLALPSGRILAAIRYQRHKLPGDPHQLASPHILRYDSTPYAKSKKVGSGLVARFTAVMYSDDNGRTWSTPRLVTGFDEQTGCLVRLSDGTVILVFGHKTDGYGQRFMLSYDRGETWSRNVYNLAKGGLYASSVVLKDDTIVTVYHNLKKLTFHCLRWRAPSRKEVAKGGFWRPRPVEPLGIPRFAKRTGGN